MHAGALAGLTSRHLVSLRLSLIVSAEIWQREAFCPWYLTSRPGSGVWPLENSVGFLIPGFADRRWGVTVRVIVSCSCERTTSPWLLTLESWLPTYEIETYSYSTVVLHWIFFPRLAFSNLLISFQATEKRKDEKRNKGEFWGRE